MIEFSISTDLIEGEFFDKLDEISQAGFHAVELEISDIKNFHRSLAKIKSYCDALKLNIYAINCSDRYSLLFQKNKTGDFPILREYLEYAQHLDVSLITLRNLGVSNERTIKKDIISIFVEAAELAKTFNCRLALPESPWTYIINNELMALDLINEVSHTNFGFVINSTQCLTDGTQAARFRDVPEDRIFLAQLSDSARFGQRTDGTWTTSRLLPGEGVLNLESFVKILSRNGYKGPWSISNPYWFKLKPRKNFSQDAFRSLVSLLDEVAKSEVNISKPLQDLPSKVQVTGFEFIEFSVDKKTHKEIKNILASMAFRLEKTHKTKKVELWRQGSINVVLNLEMEGHSGEAFIQNGPCVCDMGVRVKDARQTVQRATMLGTPSFSQRLGDGELNIPAIKAGGANVVHFIDEKSNAHRVWDIEFVPVAGSKYPQPSGLRRIDHVAQTMKHDEMRSWLTYYLSNFDMRKSDVLDINDPSGLIMSQAISSPEGEVRLNLNGALDQKTFAGSFLKNDAVAGVQHIAFTTDDIFETSEKLNLMGFERLKIPEDYYESLEADFKLDKDFKNRLKDNQILYDRDDKGEYFQIYSLPFWNGFFFEIVQRSGRFDGYGARNASTRLIAQSEFV